MHQCYTYYIQQPHFLFQQRRCHYARRPLPDQTHTPFLEPIRSPRSQTCPQSWAMFIQRHLPIPMTRIKLGKIFHSFWNGRHRITRWSYRAGRSFYKLVEGSKVHGNAWFCRIFLWNYLHWVTPIIRFRHPPEPAQRHLSSSYSQADYALSLTNEMVGYELENTCVEQQCWLIQYAQDDLSWAPDARRGRRQTILTIWPP